MVGISPPLQIISKQLCLCLDLIIPRSFDLGKNNWWGQLKLNTTVLSKDIFFTLGGPVSSSAESLQKYLSYDQINILQFIIANKWKMSISQKLSKMCLLWWMQNKYRDLALYKVGQCKNSEPLTSGNRVNVRQGFTKNTLCIPSLHVKGM